MHEAQDVSAVERRPCSSASRSAQMQVSRGPFRFTPADQHAVYGVAEHKCNGLLKDIGKDVP